VGIPCVNIITLVLTWFNFCRWSVGQVTRRLTTSGNISTRRAESPPPLLDSELILCHREKRSRKSIHDNPYWAIGCDHRSARPIQPRDTPLCIFSNAISQLRESTASFTEGSFPVKIAPIWVRLVFFSLNTCSSLAAARVMDSLFLEEHR